MKHRDKLRMARRMNMFAKVDPITGARTTINVAKNPFGSKFWEQRKQNIATRTRNKEIIRASYKD